MTLILSNDDVEKLLTMPECIEVMEEAYIELAEGRGVSRTRSDCFTPTTRADALYSLKSMDGVVPKLGVGAVRINSDIITWPKRGNNMRREKVPAAPNNRYVGLVLLFSVENGEPPAILPDGVMQRMRVGAANGLGIKYLARENAKTVARYRGDPLLQPERAKSRHVCRRHDRAAGRQGRAGHRARSGDQRRRHRDVRQQFH
jgi:alanine dehydrogenase